MIRRDALTAAVQRLRIPGTPVRPTVPLLLYRLQSLSILAVATFLLVACASPQTAPPEVESVAAQIEAKKQRALALHTRMEAQERLQRVGFRVLSKGVSLCKDEVAPSVGAWMWNNGSVEKEWKETVLSEYGVSDLVQVAFVAPDSPATTAGLQPGDIPITLNRWEVPVGDNAMPQVQKRLRDFMKSEKPVKFRVRREDQEVDVHVTPALACDFEVVLEESDEKNAYADGKRIVVTQGMMDFFKTDEELALVVSHELAHDAMGHIDAKKQNVVTGGILGLLVDIAAAAAGVNTQGAFSDLGADIGARAYSVGFEQEADYVGLYFMALAGYEIEGAPNFWRRLAIQDPKSIALKTTHPTTPERFVAMEKAIEEIKAKIIADEPLEPEMKPEPTEPAEIPEDYLESG